MNKIKFDLLYYFFIGNYLVTSSYLPLNQNNSSRIIFMRFKMLSLKSIKKRIVDIRLSSYAVPTTCEVVLTCVKFFIIKPTPRQHFSQVDRQVDTECSPAGPMERKWGSLMWCTQTTICKKETQWITLNNNSDKQQIQYRNCAKGIIILGCTKDNWIRQNLSVAFAIQKVLNRRNTYFSKQKIWLISV